MREVKVRKYGPAHKFRPDDYEEYRHLPRWMLDSLDFVSKDDYHAHWATTIMDWLQQAKNRQSKWKSTCQDAVKTIEEVDDGSNRTYNAEKGLAYKQIRVAKAYVNESVALLCVNRPQGSIVGMQESLNPLVAAGNQLVDAEFKANDFDSVFQSSIYDTKFFRVGWWKTWVDYTRYGPYGQKGKIVINSIDPENIHVDADCKHLDWSNMTYIIEESEHDIGDLRETYPVSGFEVSEFAESPRMGNMLDERSQDNISSPLPKMGKGVAAKRQKIKTYECWFKDTRLEFIPEREDKTDFDPLTGEMEIEKDALKLDEDGYVLGEWLPMYPNGRCIVLCEDTILEDMPNRLPHGECPYVAVLTGPARNPFTPGIAVDLITMGQKYNDLISRKHHFGQSETTRPMECEMGTFSNTQYYKRVTNDPNKMVILSQGKTGTLNRRPPTETPTFVDNLTAEYKQLMDLVSGSSAIMRGTLSDGAQLSAEAMASLQQFASCRVAVEAKNSGSSVKKITRQVYWLIRATYDEGVKVQVTMPDGKTDTVDWQSDKAVFESQDEMEIAKLVSREDFIIEIKAGTGTPNAQQARKGEADHLYDRKAIDRPALLDAYEYPDRKQINTRMEERENTMVAQEALGRKLGMNIVKGEKESQPPGAKPKYNGG
jgi:hypothetical protein